MTNKKFIAYNLIATGAFMIIIAISSGFFSNEKKEGKINNPEVLKSEIPVRKIKITETERQDITFILGEDDEAGENYYASATCFYKNHLTEKTEQVILSCRSIFDVRELLAERYVDGQLPWGKINLVVHGNEWSGLAVATLPGGKRTTLNTLQSAIKNRSIPSLPKYIADECTEIHIHGCAVGKNKKLVNKIGELFGGHQPIPVFSSEYFLRYEKSNNSKNCSRTQLEPWYTFYPKTYRPETTELISNFQHKYPSVKMDWEDALSRDHPRFNSDIYHHTFDVPVLWTVAYENNQSVPDLDKWSAQKKWLSEQKELQELLRSYNIPWDNFQWTFLDVTHEMEDGRKLPAIKAIGLCTVLTVLKPVDGQKLSREI